MPQEENPSRSLTVLFLDDNLERHKVMRRNSIGVCSVQGVMDADGAISAMLDPETNFDLIMLDHDLSADMENILGTDEKDGRYVARWMAQQDRHRDTPIIIHSLNDAGRTSMEFILVNAGFKCVAQLPFAWNFIEKGVAGGIVFNPLKPKAGPH